MKIFLYTTSAVTPRLFFFFLFVSFSFSVLGTLGRHLYTGRRLVGGPVGSGHCSETELRKACPHSGGYSLLVSLQPVLVDLYRLEGDGR